MADTDPGRICSDCKTRGKSRVSSSSPLKNNLMIESEEAQCHAAERL